MNNFFIKQVILHIDPKHKKTLKKLTFDIHSFGRKYQQKLLSSYIYRNFNEISYKISSRLHCILHIKKNHISWMQRKNINDLYQHILGEIYPHLKPKTKKKCVYFLWADRECTRLYSDKLQDGMF
jgi:hypothetical protein